MITHDPIRTNSHGHAGQSAGSNGGREVGAVVRDGAIGLVDAPAALGCLLDGFSSEFFAKAMVTAQLAVAVWSIDGKLLFITPTAALLLRRSVSELTGKMLSDLLSPEESAARIKMLRAATHSAKPLVCLEVVDGRSIYTVAVPAYDQAGHCQGVMTILHTGHAAETFRLDPDHYEIVASQSKTGHEPTALTPREREMLEMFAAGMTLRQIAKSLHRSIKTVEWYRSQLGKKLGATTRAELKHMAAAAGLLGQAAQAEPPAKALPSSFVEGAPQTARPLTGPRSV